MDKFTEYKKKYGLDHEELANIFSMKSGVQFNNSSAKQKKIDAFIKIVELVEKHYDGRIKEDS